ncbi:MAG: hypothetical protein V5A22_08195 [Salinivenus sp.]
MFANRTEAALKTLREAGAEILVVAVGQAFVESGAVTDEDAIAALESTSGED